MIKTDTFHPNDELCSNRLPDVPRAIIRGAFRDFEGNAFSMQLIPETDSRFNVIEPVHWILPGVKPRLRRPPRGSASYTARSISTEDLQQLASERGFTVQIIQ